MTTFVTLPLRRVVALRRLQPGARGGSSGRGSPAGAAGDLAGTGPTPGEGRRVGGVVAILLGQDGPRRLDGSLVVRPVVDDHGHRGRRGAPRPARPPRWNGRSRPPVAPADATPGPRPGRLNRAMSGKAAFMIECSRLWAVSRSAEARASRVPPVAGPGGRSCCQMHSARSATTGTPRPPSRRFTSRRWPRAVSYGRARWLGKREPWRGDTGDDPDRRISVRR